MLKNSGFSVEGVQDARTAYQKARQCDYDLVLLDMAMPGMNGLQLMSHFDRAGIDVPVVVVSGITSFGTVRRALRKGAYDYVKKPYDVSQLVTTVREALAKHRMEQGRAALQKCMEESERFHRYAVNSLSDIVFTLDPRGRFSYLNHRIGDLLGYAGKDLIGRPFSYLLDEEDSAKATLLFNDPSSSLDHPKTRELRLKINGSSKASRCFEVTAFPLEIDSADCSSGQGSACFPAQVFGLARDITERKEAEAFISFHASHDLLTRLPNRTLFRDRLNLAITQAIRSDQKFAVMFLDLNKFKCVNDTFGHAAGDRLLQNIAQRLRMCLREGDTLSRFGGDEFTLLLPGVRTEEDAQVTARKLIGSLQPPLNLDGNEVQVGVSVGIAMFPEAGRSLDELLQHADTAMYQAKRRGQDGYQFYR